MFLTWLGALFGKKRESTVRISGNTAKQMFQARARNVSLGFTIAGPKTQEYKRIIAASRRKPKPHKNTYGGANHLRLLKATIVGKQIDFLLRRYAKAVA